MKSFSNIALIYSAIANQAETNIAGLSVAKTVYKAVGDNERAAEVESQIMRQNLIRDEYRTVAASLSTYV